MAETKRTRRRKTRRAGADVRGRSRRTSRDQGARGEGWRIAQLIPGNRLVFLATSLLTLLVVGMLGMAYLMRDLPDVSGIMQVSKAPSIVIRTRSGDIIGSSGDIYGEFTRYDDIPPSLIKAVLATEDRNFFQHGGIDPFGILRAAVANFRAGSIVQGGSTITQQLAKNVFLTPERSLKRKIQEMILALMLEHRYSKQDIITVYLNRVYFGAGTYGIDAASRRYFGKSAKKLLLPESAMIAGLLKAPSRYAPTSNTALAIGRAKQVLLNMVDAGLINEGQMKGAAAMYTGLSFPKFASNNGRRYFTDWILEQIPDYVGNIDRDLIVTTTYEPLLQAEAEKALAVAMHDKLAASTKAGEGALVSMSPDGAVLAMLGGKDYSKSQFNRATQARRQPGSAFKLFVYLAALEAGWRPYSMIDDAPVYVGNWAPANYDGKYRGEMFLREAFQHSTNTVAVRLSESVGRGKVIEMAHRLGLRARMGNIPSIALGVTASTLMEMTTAYAHVAAGGQIVIPYGIVSVQDTMGKVIYQHESGNSGRVLSADTVAQMNDMLMLVVEAGTGRAANISRPAGGKTGTCQDFRDAWFIGFTPQLITGVWVGNDNNSPMRKITGGHLPAKIWHDYMQAALEDQPVYSLPRDAAVGEGALQWFGLDGEGQPNDGHAVQQGQPPQGQNAHPRKHEDEGSLDKSFWDTLFSEDNSEPAPVDVRKLHRIKR